MNNQECEQPKSTASSSSPLKGSYSLPAPTLQWVYSLIVGTAVFIYVTGGRIIDPTNTSWLMNGDAAKPTRAALALNGAAGIPVFAGTDITDSGDAKTNTQLDGIEFLQMPWLVNRGNSLNISAAQLLKLPSARGPGAKLNAFGADAWLIATRLPVWLASPNSEIGGATGNLHLEPDGRIERTLSWSVFRAGVPQAANGP